MFAVPEPFQVEARSLAAAAQTSPTWTRWMLVALAPAGSRHDFAALRGRVARRRALDWAAPLACGGSFEEAASAVLTGLPRGNAERPSEAPGRRTLPACRRPQRVKKRPRTFDLAGRCS